MFARFKAWILAWLSYRAGEQAQQGKDRDATLKVAEDAARIESDLAGRSDESKRDELRRVGPPR